MPRRNAYPDAPAALEDLLFDGMAITSGGFGLSGDPEHLIPAHQASGVRVAAHDAAAGTGEDR